VGTGSRQPGGWIYQSLPYLEQSTVVNIGLGLAEYDLIKALSEQGKAVIPIFNCPSRRPAELYPSLESKTYNYFSLDFSAKTDYAANGGSTDGSPGGTGPRVGTNFYYSDCRNGYPNCAWLNSQTWIDLGWNGIVADRSGIEMRQISDGASYTLLAGEKWVYEIYYEVVSVDSALDNATNRTAADNPGDNGSMYTGFNSDSVRYCSTRLAPKRDSEYDPRNPQSDKKGAHYQNRFGGPHAAGINLVYCDGSVHTLDFEADPQIWTGLGARNDGGD
jgi:prepilin-type processing-associated H-X9-DG protein